MIAQSRVASVTDEPKTFDLLERWRAGDADALDVLLQRDLGWIQRFVHRRLGAQLRKMGDTGDFVQEAALRVLRFGPRFVLESRAQFRALLGTIVTNVLRAKHRELHTLKRGPDREQPMGGDTTLYLDAPQRPVTRPDEAAALAEQQEWLRLGLLLLGGDDQTVIELYWQGLTDKEIGEQVGVSDNAARMRRHRAIERLTTCVLKLKSGGLATLLAETADDDGA